MRPAERTAAVRALWPLLVVRDLDRSVRFYRERLGFTVVGQAEADGRMFWCRLERGQSSIMLQREEAEDGPADNRACGISLFFLCDDADAMHAELAARGLLLAPPRPAYYGMTQLFVPEPDGYVLCFESPTAHP
jgi:catechol 2,3-dioxygenase-like lactoylglutathione lyase family enzyme